MDVEYGVQYLQLIYGHQFPRLRTPNTLEGLAALREHEALSSDDTVQLHRAYLFFRVLIDGLRIVRGHAKDLVLPPPDSDAFIYLARRVGYQTESWEEGARALQEDVRRTMGWTQAFIERRFSRYSAEGS